MSTIENMASEFSDVIKSKRIFAPEDAYMEHVEIILVGNGPYDLFIPIGRLTIAKMQNKFCSAVQIPSFAYNSPIHIV